MNEKGRDPVVVEVSPKAFVAEVVGPVLDKVKLSHIPPDKVTVIFGDGEVDFGNIIKDELDLGHGDSKPNHFLLELPEDEDEDDGKKTLIFK